MNGDWQDISALGIVIASLLFLVARGASSLRQRRAGCGGGCAGCAGGESAAPRGFVSIGELTGQPLDTPGQSAIMSADRPRR